MDVGNLVLQCIGMGGQWIRNAMAVERARFIYCMLRAVDSNMTLFFFHVDQITHTKYFGASATIIYQTVFSE